MKLLLTTILAFGLLSPILCSCPAKDNQQQCNELDYSKYVQCIRKQLRQKRSYDCEDECSESDGCYNSCNDCNCDYCAGRPCENFCSQCCQSTTCSTSNCCHRTCHAQCRTSKCRHECKRECVDNIDENQQQVDIATGNITTIITLHTAINNTNVIDVPISINNTNINNFTLDSSFLYPDYRPLPEKVVVLNTTTVTNQKCCNVVNQGNCSQAPNRPVINCTYPVRQQCGPYCNYSPIVHRQPISSCPYGQCMAYIPQPRPRCIHHPIWPYVSCGIQQQQQQPFCGGCYHHYNSFPYFQPPPMHCSPACYDEGYGIGPYYRQGPFYRQSFMHAPACYQMGGNCFDETSPWDYQNQLYPPYLASPFDSFGGGNEILPLLPETVEMSLDKLPTDESQFVITTLQPLVSVEARVNYTKPQRVRKKSNLATLTIGSNRTNV